MDNPKVVTSDSKMFDEAKALLIQKFDAWVARHNVVDYLTPVDVAAEAADDIAEELTADVEVDEEEIDG